MALAEVPSLQGDERTYYSVAQTAALLGVSRVSIWRWISSGKLPASRLGHRTVRIKHTDLQAFLEGGSPSTDSSLPITDAPEGWPPINGTVPDEDGHLVQFYESDEFLLDSVASFIGSALETGDAGIVVATQAHREGLAERLQARGIDLAAATASGQFAPLDAGDALSKFMVDAVPDAGRFLELFGGLIARAGHGRQRVAIFGEMVALLAVQGNEEATLRLEELWNDLGRTQRFSLFCAYPLDPLASDRLDGLLQRVCEQHGQVIPTEGYLRLATDDERTRAIVELEQKARRLEYEIAERRQVEETLREREDELRDFVEQGPIGLHWVGADGRILWANEAELALLGYARDEYIGHHIAEFHDDQGAISDILERLNQKETLHEHEARLLCKDGSIKHVLISSNVRWEGDRFLHTRCFTVDISERKRLAEARDTALTKLQQLLETREEFLSSAAHDLKNPLTAIKAHAEILRLRAEKGAPADLPQLLHGLNAIESSTKRMVTLIDELVDVGLLQLGQPLELNRCRVDLVDLARRVAAEHQQSTERHRFLFTGPGQLSGDWDAARLERVLGNLLSNATRFSPAGGDVLVSLKEEQLGTARWAVLAVQDEGVGIPAKDLDRVFERFERGSNVVGRIGGTGIGLASVRQIVEAHDGRISVQSHEGAGSTFTVRLPLGAEETQASAAVEP